MERDERDTLIKVEQQLKDSVQNQDQILSDLKDIFQRIENESKTITTMQGELRGHVDNSKIKWSNLEQRLTSYEKNNENIKEKNDNLENCFKKLKNEQTSLETSVKTSVRVTKWLLSIIAGFGSLIGTIALMLQLFKG